MNDEKHGKNKKHSLQFKVALFFVVGIILSVAVVGISIISSMQTSLEQEVYKNQMLLATGFSTQVEQYFNDAKGVVNLTAQLPAVKDMSSRGLIRDDIKGVPEQTDRPKRDVINFVLKEYGQFGYMEQVTETGDNVVIEPWGYQLDLQRLNFSDRDWFRTAIETRAAHVSEVYISSSMQQPVIAISTPVLDNRGAISAVWMGALTLNKLSELSQTLTFGETGHAYLVDQHGTLAAYTDFAMVEKMQDISQAPAVARVLEGKSGTETLEDPFLKKDYLTSYLPVGKTGWGIIVVQDPDEAFAPVKSTLALAISVCIGLVVIAVIFAILIARSISRPISRLAAISQQVGRGDLTVAIDVRANDEVGLLADGFKQMVQHMHKIIREIVSQSGTIAGSSQELSASAEETAASASQTSATMTEISSTVEQVSANIQRVSDLSETAAGQADMGRDGIARVIQQMAHIASSTQEVTGTIDGLNKRSQEISQIVELITNIADQTNLLALNAAIEAARAGEQGRGFAVVADEVRKLAEQSADAAKEINSLIHAIQVESQKAVDTMASGDKEVDAGTQIVEEVGAGIQTILNTVQELTKEMQEIASATQQMSSGVQNVAASAQEQTATMEEVSASVQSLSRLSEELSSLVNQFKI